MVDGLLEGRTATRAVGRVGDVDVVASDTRHAESGKGSVQHVDPFERVVAIASQEVADAGQSV